MALTIICGGIGAGKTALGTLFGLERMSRRRALWDLSRLSKIRRVLLSEGQYHGMPQDHLVYSDIAIIYKRAYRLPQVSHFVSGWRIGLLNEFYETDKIPSCSFVLLDEATKYYDGKRTTGKLRTETTMFYSLMRQNFLTVVMTCQRPVFINRDIRELAERFIFPTIRPLDKYGKVVRLGDKREIAECYWDCIEFGCTDSAEEYSRSGNESGSKKTKYYYPGNIFKCYNSFAHIRAFYIGREGQDFLGTTTIRQAPTLTQLVAPSGFYLGKG